MERAEGERPRVSETREDLAVEQDEILSDREIADLVDIAFPDLGREAEGILALTTVEEVLAEPAVEQVVPAPADQPVGARCPGSAGSGGNSTDTFSL